MCVRLLFISFFFTKEITRCHIYREYRNKSTNIEDKQKRNKRPTNDEINTVYAQLHSGVDNKQENM